MDGPPRRPPVLRQRSDSQGRALSPADSVTSLGGTRAPLLSVMFHHIRRDHQDSLTKEDLRRLLDVDMDNEQLDEAFENLDVDGDGRVSQDEFLGGFARFLLEAPTTPGKDRNSLLLGIGQEQGGQRGRGGGRKRGSVRRRLVDEECYESTAGTHAMNGAERPSENGEPAVKPSETFAGSLSTLSSHNKHSIVTLWRSLAGTNPELLVDFEEFVGEVAEEVEHAQRALENQRKATKQEALELDQEMESRLNAANTHLQIQTALTEVKTKLKLEQRLGDREKELTAVKQKLQELESEVQAGQHAHTQLEEQFEVLSQEKAYLQSRLEAREAVLMKKHEEMEQLNKQASENVSMHSSHFEDTQVELQEIKREYEREISELKEKILEYEITSDDDEMSLLSGQTPDLLSTMSSRHRHTSRHSLLDEIVKQIMIVLPGYCRKDWRVPY
ncbi:hypothetical protein GBAR_LOCUS15735 [Geodia barretti]|uniref:EF-hand domain-containing protein n=1 Tax=Geodia barretti TaxID=519541 RepID=A0AA35SCF1_GEOBA|nr:hypothetical protein GBAR_LOCUS15735 [Geodia barretti]